MSMNWKDMLQSYYLPQSQYTNPIAPPTYTEKAKAIMDIYKKSVGSQSDGVDSRWHSFLVNRSDISQNPTKYTDQLYYYHSPEAFQDLKIEFEIEHIQEAAEKCGVLPLRQMGTKDRLVIGCGNLTPTDRQIEYIDHYDGDGTTHREEHSHADADTLDPDIFRNPTTVGGLFEDQKTFEKQAHNLEALKAFFPKDRYKEIELEGIIIKGVDLIAIIKKGDYSKDQAESMFRFEPYMRANCELLYQMLDKEEGIIEYSDGTTISAKQFKELLDYFPESPSSYKRGKSLSDFYTSRG